MKIKSTQKGFIALTFIITISAILLAFTFIISLDSATFFDQVMRKEYRLMNYYSAYNCIDRAILNSAHDYFYQVSTSTIYADLNCSIDSVKDENGLRIIKARGNFRNIFVQRTAKIILFKDRLEIFSIQ